MAEIIDFLEYKEKKEKEELAGLQEQVADILRDVPVYPEPYYTYNTSQPPGLSETWGFSFYSPIPWCWDEIKEVPHSGDSISFMWDGYEDE